MNQDRHEVLILNIDYCGNCRGTCTSCLLSKEERLLEAPFLTRSAMGKAIEVAAAKAKPTKSLVIGIGRGNTLTLPESSIEDVVLMIQKIASTFSYESMAIELSTSLIGKIEPQVSRAIQLSEALAGVVPEAPLRFVVVVNPDLVSNAYWRNLNHFFGAMSEYRGSKDGDGDIAVINLGPDKQPDAQELVDQMIRWKFPINVTWVGGRQIQAPTPEESSDKLGRVSQWLTRFYQASKKHDLDISLVTRIDDAIRAGQGLGHDDLEDFLAEANSCLLFIDHEGKVTNGAFTALLDMDRVRFPGMEHDMTPQEEISNLLRYRSCKSCEHFFSCVAAGGTKTAIANAFYLNDLQTPCITGLKPILVAASEIAG